VHYSTVSRTVKWNYLHVLWKDLTPMRRGWFWL
jgi:hypothetical protein